MGGRQRSVVLFAPTIQQPWVRITPSTLFSICIIEIVMRKGRGKMINVGSANSAILRLYTKVSVTSKKLPNVYRNCPNMISLEKLKILTPLQKLPENLGDLGKLIVA